MKSTIASIIIAVALIGGVFAIKGGTESQPAADSNAVSVVDGSQIIEIRAKGGYWPKKVVAQAGIPTILRFSTQGTFDCSSSLIIPAKGISKMLPQTGTTDVDIGINEPGRLLGSCSMGMYPFEIVFQG